MKTNHNREKINHSSQTPNGSPLLLLICATGICGCYLYFGKVQEQMFSKGSGSKAFQEAGSITTFMLVLSCMTNVLVALCWISVTKVVSVGRNNASTLGSTAREKRSLNHVLLIASKS